MSRTPRLDEPGSWHHVMNRGIARRTLFERREDFRHFLGPLAVAVRRGEIEVHAYCLMATHYHLLLRSPQGRLATAMQRVQLTYSRWFNRSRKRDGPLVRNRYTSKLIHSDDYQRILVRYIDANPVRAGLAKHAGAYPYGSAFHYSKAQGPPWLERSWVQEVVREQMNTPDYRPSDYACAFGGLPPSLTALVEARTRTKHSPGSLDNLVRASRPRIKDWMQRKARLADGTTPNAPIVALEHLEDLLRDRRAKAWMVRRGQRKVDAWSILYSGLGRDVCGATLARLANRAQVSQSAISKRCATHRQEMLRGDAYAERAARIVHEALADWRNG